MLFSSLLITSPFDDNNDREEADSTARIFLLRAGQTLVVGQCHRARPDSVEALVLYAYCKWSQGRPGEGCMDDYGYPRTPCSEDGYHRDPRHLTSITPIEGEMRRRTFFLVEIVDLLFAFQAGLPSIIHEEECDLEPPSNLLDTGFAEDCKELPPSRSPADPTPMLYFCYKSRIAKTLRRVIQHALSLKTSPYEDTIKLYRELHEQYKKGALSLQVRPLSSSIIEPAVVIFQRYSIELMHLKRLCVLQRSFLSHGRLDPAYDYSRKLVWTQLREF